MSEAIFGLVGVVVGALITGGVDYVLDRRRERATLRAALRLIGDEYKDLLGVVDLALMASAWPRSHRYSRLILTADQWERNRDVLAAQLSPVDWELIAQGRDVRHGLQHYMDEHEHEEELIELILDSNESILLEAWQETLERIIMRTAVLSGAPSETIQKWYDRRRDRRAQQPRFSRPQRRTRARRRRTRQPE